MNNIKKSTNILTIWGLILFSLLATHCSSDDGPNLKAPQLTVNGASSITRTSAVLSGTIISNGNNISECGFLYSTARADLQATDTNAKKVRTSNNSSEVSATIQSLEAGTTYYFCLYAKSGASQVLSTIASFTTSKQEVPGLNDVKVLETSEYSIKVKCSIMSDGGAQIKQFGFDYKKINETKWTSQYTDTFDEGSTTDFTMTLNGLDPETEYNIRAVAINSQGTSYSEEIKQKTEKLTAPVVTTQNLNDNDLGANWVKVIGFIENKGASEEIVTRGFCWSTTNKEPTNTDNRKEVDTDTNEFSTTITDLIPNTTYYLRAYAANKINEQTQYGYGNVIIFTTQAYVKTAFTEVIANECTAATADLKCTITPGTGNIKSKGFCYSKSNKSPTIEHSVALVETESHEMSVSLEGLEENTTYYVRAFVTSTGLNGKEETEYSETTEFKTIEYVAVSFSNIKADEITKHTVKLSAVIDAGTVSLIEKGFCWKKGTDTPTINDHKQVIENADFECELTDLEDNSNYKVRAYAICKRGSKQETVYSEQMVEFATLAYKLPLFSELTSSDITKTTATLTATMTSGDVIVIEKGFCWGTSVNPTTDNNKIVIEGDELTTTLTDLQHNKTYYYRMYAIYKKGESETSETTYSASAYFTTDTYKYPTATTEVTDITLTSAKVTTTLDLENSEVTITEKGFCWAESSKTDAPTLTNNDGTVVIEGDDFSYTMENLTSGKRYYVRVYIKIKESDEAFYYPSKEFTSKTPTKPSFKWWNPVEIVEVTNNSFKVKAVLESVGLPAATEVGFCWSTTKDQAPEKAEHKKSATLLEDNSFTLTMNDQKSGSVLYVYAYATNDAGTVYSNECVTIKIKRSPTDDDNTSPDKIK